MIYLLDLTNSSVVPIKADKDRSIRIQVLQLDDPSRHGLMSIIPKTRKNNMNPFNAFLQFETTLFTVQGFLG